MSYRRIRQRGGFSRSPTSEWAKNVNCVTPNWFLNQILSNQVSSGDYQEMHDEVVPKYHERVAKGEIFNNYLSSITRAYTVSAGQGAMLRSVANSCAAPAVKSEYRLDGPALGIFLPTEIVGGISVPKLQYSVTNSDLDRVCTEASTKVMASRASGTLWETVAELDKTVAMFSQPIAKYAKLLSGAERAFRQGRLSRATAEASAQAWLTWRYGITPLLNDIKNIQDNLKKQLGRHRGTTRSFAQETGQTTVVGSGTYGVIKVNWQCQVTDVMSIRAWSLDDYTLDALNQFGFTTKGLLTLPWELTPYSLVADWFVNFGDFLGAIAPAVGWKQLSSGLTVSHATSNVYTTLSTVSTSPAYTITVPQTGSVAMSHLAKQRRPLYSPGLVVKSNFKLDSFTRAADAMSFVGNLTKMVFSPRSGVSSNLRI